MMNHQREFHEAIITYLRKAELVELHTELKLTESGKYRHLCFMKSYTKTDSEERASYRLIVPTFCWHDLLKRVESIFESKINGKLIDETVNRTICDLTEFPFTEETLLSYAETIFQEIWLHYQLSIEALVPLNNLMIQGDNEIPLANCILCSGSSHSLLAQKVRHPLINNRLSELENKCFLRIMVTGDDESRLRQVETEVEKSLAVLRYITMWSVKNKGTKQVKYNPAIDVSLREQERRWIVYHKQDDPTSKPGFYSDTVSLHYLRKNDIDIAYQYYGLENINYHYQNSDNQVSRRVVRALELYDSGVQAKSNWQALYRYVVSINVVLPKSVSKGEELVEQLTKLIEYGGSYVGSMKKGNEETDPETLTWPELVKRTAEPFKEFYMLRGKILHGNLPLDELSDQATEDARVLAHNAIRLVAFLAKEFNWQSDKQSANWFKSPKLPPSLEIETE